MTLLSSRHPNLPDIVACQALCRSAATLTALFLPETSERTFFYGPLTDRENNPVKDCMSFAYRAQDIQDPDGYELLFTPKGALLVGVHSQSVFFPRNPINADSTPPEILDSVPDVLRGYFPLVYHLNDATFCLWRLPVDAQWHASTLEFPSDIEDPDGSEEYLWLLDGKPETFMEWLNIDENFDEPAKVRRLIRHIYAQKPLSYEMVEGICDIFEWEWEAFCEENQSIGYPLID